MELLSLQSLGALPRRNAAKPVRRPPLASVLLVGELGE